MFIRPVAAGLFALMLTFAGTSAVAWNDRGHMMVAAIAWEALELPVQERVSELLRLSPMYSRWVENVSPANRDKIAFVRAATWPDVIKYSSSGYHYDGATPDQSDGANRNEGYSDLYQHRYWHYKDLPFSQDGTPLAQPPSPNAHTQIELFRNTLASNASDDIKSYDLVWLIHLVGDVHQPLHATQRFSQATPKGDKGGNDVRVCEAPCGSQNSFSLHSFWDGAAGPNASPWVAIASADALPEADAVEAADSTVGNWFEESFKIAKSVVYGPPIGPGTGPFEITNTYRKDARKIAERRIALAGARLGKLINDYLGTTATQAQNLDR